MFELWRGICTLVLVVALIAANLPGGKHERAPAPGSPAALLTPTARAGGLTFAPEVAQADRQVVLAAIARARPEARRLVEAVDGLVTIGIGGAGPDAAGYTQGLGQRFEVVLDIGGVWHQSGDRGVRRLVLHELGHVVDSVLLTPELRGSLDAGIPAGYACDPGVADGACTTRSERFAETFAKWATGDLGVDINLGYKVLAPSSLEEWGAPLVALRP